MNDLPKLALAPISRDIIQAVYSYSHNKQIPLMLSASKNQVDYSSGYVMTTKDLVDYCAKLEKKYHQAQVTIGRDHCGPGYNGIHDLIDTYRTVKTDIENNFDYIHLDFGLYSGDYHTSLLEAKKTIEIIKIMNPNIKLIIGNSINTGGSLPSAAEVEDTIEYFEDLCQPRFFACETGSQVREATQTGKYNKDYIGRLYKTTKTHKLPLIEHNADYLSRKEIKLRKNKIAIMCLAPSLGTLQTKLTLAKAREYKIDTNEFLDTAYKSKRWQKWLKPESRANEYMCSLIAGHYCFRTSAYKKLYEAISDHEDFSKSIEKEVHKLITSYLK